MGKREEIDRNPERLAFIMDLMAKERVRPPVVTVGMNTRIHPTVVFGTDGFTAERKQSGAFLRAPNYGDVVICDDVRIGEYSVVRRSTLPGTATRVGSGTNILSFVVIGHNCEVGKDCFIGNHVQLCGSVKIGDRCWISPHVVVHQHVKVGNDVFVGLGAVVLDDVPDGTTVAGVPAVPSGFADNHVHPDFAHGKGLVIGKYNIIEQGVSVGDGCVIRNRVELRSGTVIGDGCYVDSGVKSSGKCTVGDNVTLRYDAIIARNVVIGDDVFISPQVAFINLPFVEKEKRRTLVGRGAKIGTSATIADGVEIGEGVIIGAKSFVNRDCLEPGRYVGVPARRID